MSLPFQEGLPYYSSDEDCLSDLFNYKAIVCQVDRIAARKLILMDLKRNRDSTIKILQDESIVRSHYALFIESNSPYVFEFERYFTIFLQTGLTYKWDDVVIEEDTLKVQEKNLTFNSETPIIPLIIILGIGLGIAIIVFIGELLLCKHRK